MVLSLTGDSPEVVHNKNLIRRRFYLSKESLIFLDSLALSQEQSPSILLDSILRVMASKQA